ncbi:MAG: helix-turn-helix domain-containing protein [Gammaproteobacteria bacterium]|nr:helix-turn-helix domain-containing protein [Gammaproteobacteria bacterium]
MSDWPVLLRSYRREKGLKQEALAYMLNVDQTTISRWERGKDNPSLAIQKRLRDLFWTKQDSALDAAVRIVRYAPLRATVVLPGTRIVEVSDAYAEHHGLSRKEMKGDLLRKFLGDDFYEQYMVPVGKIGIYSGDVARVEYLAKVRMKDGTWGYSYSSVVPIFGSSGTYAVSQSQFVPQSFVQDHPGMKVYRFDEIVD